MDIYEDLGVRRIINAAATLTTLGGSVLPPEVRDAMVAAATAHVDLVDLQEKIDVRLASMTHNEGAYVCSGAAGGLILAAAACATGPDPARVARLVERSGLPDEIALHAAHRFSFDRCLRLAGFRLREFGAPHQTTTADLAAALSAQTAAVLYVVAPHVTGPGTLPLEAVVATAHAQGLPVIVDAAAQLPPASNLWHFTTEVGADLAVFSGGKDLRGPQGSGLVVGRRDLIAAVALHGNPHIGIGRPMKVGKEELVGLYAAVKRYLSLDHEALGRRYEERVQAMIGALAGLAGVQATRDYPNEAGQPAPRVLVSLAPPLAQEQVVAVLWQGEPAIAVQRAGDDGLLLNPMTLAEEEDALVVRRLRAVVAVAPS